MDPGGARTSADIGKDIRQWCFMNKVKQRQLADLLGVEARTVRRLWYGERAPSEREIRILSKLMQKPADFFIETCSIEEEERIQRLQSEIKSKNHIIRYVSENDKLDRRLEAAVEQISNEENTELKEILIQQIELAVKAARITK